MYRKNTIDFSLLHLCIEAILLSLPGEFLGGCFLTVVWFYSLVGEGTIKKIFYIDHHGIFKQRQLYVPFFSNMHAFCSLLKYDCIV